MKITKKILAVLLVFTMLFGVTATANAANEPVYLSNSKFVNITSSQVNTKISNGDTFIVMLYLPRCLNCIQLGNNVVDKWMTDYGVTVYGVDMTVNGYPKFLIELNGYASITTPVIAFVKDGVVTDWSMGYPSNAVANLNATFAEFYGEDDSTVRVQSVDITASTMNLFTGQSYYLTANITPSNASNKSVTWTSSNESVATVRYDGRVYAMNPGTAIITVKTADGGYTDSCVVTVNEIYVTSLVITRLPYKTVYQVGETHTNDGLLLEVTYSNGEVKTLDCGYSWYPPYMDNPGQKKVEIGYGGKWTYYYITVEAEPEPDEPVTPTYKNATSVDIIVDRDFGDTNTAQLSAKINPSDAEYSRIDWLSSDISVANVNAYGLVTLNGSEGSTIITVRVTNKDGSTVTDSVTVSYTNPDDGDNGSDVEEGDGSQTGNDGGLLGAIFGFFLSIFDFFMYLFSLIFA